MITSKKSKSQDRNSKEEKLQKLKDASVKDREMSATIGRFKRPNNTDDVLTLSKSQQIVTNKPLSKSQTRIWPGSLDNLPSPEGSEALPLEKSKSKSGSSLFTIKKNLVTNEDEREKSKRKKGRWKSMLSVAWFGSKQDKTKNGKSKFSNTQTTEDSESFIFEPNDSKENKPTTPTSTSSNISGSKSSDNLPEIVRTLSQELLKNVKGKGLAVDITDDHGTSEQINKTINDNEKKNDAYNVRTPTEIYNDSKKEGKHNVHLSTSRKEGKHDVHLGTSRKEGKHNVHLGTSRKEENHGAKEIILECNSEDVLVNKSYNLITPSEISAKRLSVTSPSIPDDEVFTFDSPNVNRKDQDRRKARLFPNMNPTDHSQANINSHNGGVNVRPVYQNNPQNRRVDANMQQKNYVQDDVYSNTQYLPQEISDHNINLYKNPNIYGAINNAMPYMNNIQGRPLPPRPHINHQINKVPYIQENVYGLNSYYPKQHVNENIYSTGTYNSKIPQTVSVRSRDHINLPLQNPSISAQNEAYFKRSNSLNYGKQGYAQQRMLLNNHQTEINVNNNIVPIHHPINHSSSSDANFHKQQISLYKQRASDSQAIGIHNSEYNGYNQSNILRQRSVTVGNAIREPIYTNNIPHNQKIAMPIKKSNSLYVQKNNEVHVRPFIDKDSKTDPSQQGKNTMQNNTNMHQSQQFQYQPMQVVPRDNHVKRSHSSVGYSGISDSEYIQLLRNQDHHNVSINNQPIYGHSAVQYKPSMIQSGGYGVQRRINAYREPPIYDMNNATYIQKSYQLHPAQSGVPVRRSHSSAFPSKNVYQVQPNSRADLAVHQSPAIHRLLGLNKSDLHIRRSKSMAYQNSRTLQQEGNRLNNSQYMNNPNMYMRNNAPNEIYGHPYQNGVNFDGFDEVDRFRSLSLQNSAMNTPLSRSRTSLTMKEDNDHLHSVYNYDRNESYQKYPSFNETSEINITNNVPSSLHQNARQTSSLKESYDNQNLYIQRAQKLEVETDSNNVRQNIDHTKPNNINNEHMSLSLKNSNSSDQTIDDSGHKTLSVQNSTSSVQSESSQPVIGNHLEKHKGMLFKEFGVDMDGLITRLETNDTSNSGTNVSKDGSKPKVSSKTVEIKTSTEINTETENETEKSNDINELKNLLALNDGKNVPTYHIENKSSIRHMEPPSSL